MRRLDFYEGLVGLVTQRLECTPDKRKVVRSNRIEPSHGNCRLLRLGVRTPPFHGGNTSSNLVEDYLNMLCPTIFYAVHLTKVLPVQELRLFGSNLILVVSPDHLLLTLLFLKNHTNSRHDSLVTISGVDYPSRDDRFEVAYELLSVKFNSRVRIKTSTDELTPLPTAVKILPGANWCEREVYDLFGVLFLGHPDLRRILTDYGFEGHPLRKDFPLSGYTELRYDEDERVVACEPIEFTQEFRLFGFQLSWHPKS